MKHFLVTFLLPMTLTAQNMQQLTEQLGKTVLYGNVALSPDGAHLAWVQSTAATTSKHTYIRETSGNAPAKLVKLPTTGERTDFDLTWSPDSKTLALFSSPGEKAQRQLWIVNANGSGAKKITDLNGYAARPRWSHDGKQIAFLYIEGAGAGGPLMAAPATTGVIDTAIHNQRIAVLDIGNGQLRQVSPADLHIYDYDWSADDRTFVATAAPGPGDNNWWIAQICKIEIATGNATSIYKPSLQVAVPRWSPDGKSLAFIEGLMSDEGFHGGDLLTMTAKGSDVLNRTRGRKASVNSFFWQAPDRILLAEYVGGGSAISELNLTNNSAQTIWEGPEGIHAFGNFPDFALSKDGKVAAVELSRYNSPPEVFAGPPGEWRQLTNNNAGLQANWGKAESIEWTNEGFTIQGWVVPPSRSNGIDSGKKFPMVVLIHGGPSSLTTSEWPASFGMSRAIIAALSTRGYYVLLPNPRGSYGQGEEFTRANVRDFGGGDLRDDLAGVDAAIKKYPIDPNRLGVMGWSYGGFMTMWAVTQTNRFHAAVAGAGVANWQSYYGQNLIDQWMIPFFGASVYDNPAVYEKSSPIRFIKNVKTPTLVIVGERDAECPASQSYEFWHALKTLGVPTKLIVYDGEGHLFIEPKHQVDRLEQTVAWFDKYLK
ncbi:MAG TPA: S9 family peptidase [Candidatus Udaeobacter sp.]|nr:S9 family peptidase [Candidatus Udaeobacter sp.]